MKKKILLSMLSVCVILVNPLSTFASNETSQEVISKYITPTGDIITEYMDQDDMPDQLSAEKTDLVVSENPLLRASTTYTSTLGSLNSYKTLRASSQSTKGINKIRISCTAKYASGTVIGKSSVATPAGWQTLADYCEVSVPTSPFNLKVASGSSVHIYESNIYKGATHNLTWKK